jgi:hypothetical protein
MPLRRLELIMKEGQLISVGGGCAKLNLVGTTLRQRGPPTGSEVGPQGLIEAATVAAPVAADHATRNFDSRCKAQNPLTVDRNQN